MSYIITRENEVREGISRIGLLTHHIAVNSIFRTRSILGTERDWSDHIRRGRGTHGFDEKSKLNEVSRKSSQLSRTFYKF